MENETLIIYNFQGVACDTKFPVCDIKEIRVFNRSGDEAVYITDVKNDTHVYDSADMANVPRKYGTTFYGGFLLSDKEDIQNWIKNENRKVNERDLTDKRRKPTLQTLNAKHAVKVDDPEQKEPSDEEWSWFMSWCAKHNVPNRNVLLANYSLTGNPFMEPSEEVRMRVAARATELQVYEGYDRKA